MKITWKVVYAFLCFLAVFLIPLAYADEEVNVFFYKDGEKIESLEAGDKVTLHSEVIGANSSDYITLTLQDSSLKFSSNPSKQQTNVYGRSIGDNVWVYETEADVLTDNPTLPKAKIVRDSTQPELKDSEKPTSVSIDLNSEQIVAPGDTISAKALLEPEETVDQAYFNYLEWSVTYGDKSVELGNSRGETIEFTIPDDAINNKVKVSAVLKGQECGLSEDIAAKTVELKVNDESLSVEIFPSTDSEGIVLGKFIGFSSEILRNGKVAEDEVREGITYWWTAKMGDQFVNGTGRNSAKYVYSPEETGTLTVYLTVTLANGITLESNQITKTVVESSNSLESIEIKQLQPGEVEIGDTIGVTYKLNPDYVTDLDGASYKWEAVQEKETIATFDKLEDFSFTAQKEGTVSVSLTIAPEGEDPIKSNVLEIQVGNDVPAKIYSGEITTEQDTKNLKVGDTLTLNADLEKEGKDDFSYKWQAVNSAGDVISESDELDNFTVQPDKPGDITVTFTAGIVTDSTQVEQDPESYQAVKLIEHYTFKDGSSADTKNKEATTKVDSNDNNDKPANLDNNNSSEKTNEIVENHDPTNEILVERERATSGTTTTPEPSETSSPQTKQVNLDSRDIVTVPEVQQDVKNETSDSKPETKQVTANTSKQTSTTYKSAEGSTESTATGTEVGVNKTSSTNTNTAPASATPRLSSSNASVNTVTNSKPNTSTSTQTGTTAQNSNVFNKSANVVNPKTGTDLTIGQVSVLFVCSSLIIVSLILLIRKRHQSR